MIINTEKGLKENILILVIIQNENGLILIFSDKVQHKNVVTLQNNLKSEGKNCTLKGRKSLETRPSTGLGSCDNNDLEDHFLSKLPTHLKNSYPAALNKEPLFI